MKKKLIILSAVLGLTFFTEIARASICIENTFVFGQFRQIRWDWPSVNGAGVPSPFCCDFALGFMSFRVFDASGNLLALDSEIFSFPQRPCSTIFIPAPSCCCPTSFGGNPFCV